MKKIIVSDITLKITETERQLTFREKLSIAEKLDLVGVDCIELPLLKNFKEDEVIFRTISNLVKNAVVKVAVNKIEDVNLAYKCVKSAKNPCLQIVLPTSTTLMEYFHHLKAPSMLEYISKLVKTAKEYCEQVEFVALDAFRAEEGFVLQCVKSAVESGATSIVISDDNGEALPEDYVKLIKEIKSNVDVKLSVIPSNKLCLGTAIAVESIKAGVDGINTSSVGDYVSISQLSNIFRAKRFNLYADVSIDKTTANTISNQIGAEKVSVQVVENQKVSGVVESSATLKEVVEIIKQLGYELSDQDTGKVFEEFKRVTDKKESIDIKEFEAIVASNAMQVASTYHLVSFVVNSSNVIPATANVVLEKDGEKLTGVSTGDGPIDAAFHAIEQIIGHHYELDDFQVHAVTKGRGAVGSSIIRLRANGKLYPGNGVSTDIIGACIRAYINALNKIIYEEK